MTVMTYALTTADRQRGAARTNALQLERRAERRRQMVKVAEIVDGLEREDMSTLAFSTFVQTALALADSDAPVPGNTLDWQRMVETMATAQKIMRLELGESTSNAITATVDVEALAARVAALREAGSTAPQ